MGGHPQTSHTCCRPELRKLLDGLGLQDPQGFLFKEMMTWVQGPDPESKATLRRRCCQKLEEMIQQLQVWVGQVGVGLGSLPMEPLVFSPGFPQVRGGGGGNQVRPAGSSPYSHSVPPPSSPTLSLSPRIFLYLPRQRGRWGLCLGPWCTLP